MCIIKTTTELNAGLYQLGETWRDETFVHYYTVRIRQQIRTNNFMLSFVCEDVGGGEMIERGEMKRGRGSWRKLSSLIATRFFQTDVLFSLDTQKFLE